MHYTLPMENPDDAMEDPNRPENQEADDAPESTPDPQVDSLGDWIDRAKRAHELVDAVNLNKVAAHDGSEVSKLSTVADALHDLSEGKLVAHVEGVDDVMPEIDAEQQRKSDLFAAIAGAGWVDRMGRVLYVSAESEAVKPLELIPHREGLPEFDICIAPTQRVSYGNYGVFVSGHGIFAASIGEPANKHHWRIDRSQPYDSMDELMRSISSFAENDE
ncbi:MAG: hypothetical protein NXH95_04980 [Pseudomonadaceae bacterium]|nr:hypothetical protein [Pseudomonadaceae bacterium]